VNSSGATEKAHELGEGHLPHQLHQFLDFVLPREKRYLWAIIVVSLLGHMLCFFIFQVKIAPPMRPPRPPLQVTLAAVPPSVSEVPEAALTFLDIRNPSVFGVPPVLPGEEIKMMGRPDIYAPPLDLLAGSKIVAGMGLAAGLDAVEARAIRSISNQKPVAMPISIETPPPLSGSSFILSGSLAGRAIQRKPELPKPETKTIQGCTEIRLSVNARGMVEFADVENSCGDPAIDQTALNAARTLIFAASDAADAPLEQGKMTVYWDFVEKTEPLSISVPPAPGGSP